MFSCPCLGVRRAWAQRRNRLLFHCFGNQLLTCSCNRWDKWAWITYVEPAMRPPSLKKFVWYSGALYTLSPRDAMGQPFLCSYMVFTLFLEPMLDSTGYSLTLFLLSRPTKHCLPLRSSSHDFAGPVAGSACRRSGLSFLFSSPCFAGIYFTPYFRSCLSAYLSGNWVTDGFQSGW